MSKPKVICGDCAYFKPDLDEAGDFYGVGGRCQRNPPITEEGEWPPVTDVEWCGEHSALQGFTVQDNAEGAPMYLFRLLPK